MSTHDMQDGRGRRETSFITTSGGLLTEQLLYKLRNAACSEESVAPQSFAIGSDGPEGEAAVEGEISEAWETLVERWDEISRDNSVFEMDVSAVRNQWLLKLFGELGFEPEFQQSNLEANGIEANLSHLGWPPQESVQTPGSAFEGEPPVLHMTQPDPEARLDDGEHAGTGARQKSPHDELQTYLNASSEVQWSIVTDGLKLRVLRDFYHTYTRGYVEFDLENIFTNRNFEDFRALYRLCHASRFTSKGDDDEGPLESLYQVSIATGVKVGEDLQSNVVEALETLGNGFLTPEIRDELVEGGQDAADAYYQDQLRIVYRLLFLLFAEQRGMMADRDDLYTDEYSVSALRERAERQSVRDGENDLWEGLQVTFELVGEGRDDERLHVPGYNGGLFDDEKLTYVDSATCPNHALLDAVHNLTHVEQESYQQRISYADLGVDEIGAVYESLLEFTPQYAIEPPELKERDISSGDFYLDARGMERKETGSYYTKPELVDELIDSALKPVVEERVGAEESADAKEEALLDIDVCDPACGSGAFLIAANNFLGKRLAEIRTESAYPDEQEIRKARRSVVQHCIYGVDLNPMAVELAKVSLWINSAVENQPLSFLDHRIKQGNSLIGATEELVSSGVPVDAYETSSGREWHVGNEIRKRVRKENKNIPDSDEEVQAGLDWSSFSSGEEYVSLAEEIEELSEGSIAEVERKAELYDEFEDSESLNRERLAFDVWTAAFYWPLDGSAAEYPSPNTIEKVRREADGELADMESDLGQMCQRARELSETHSFFHWELEFPIVYDEGGFDCILSNPPWEMLEFEEEEFFAVSRPDIANADTQAERKQLINQLESEDKDLYKRYRDQKDATAVLSEFIRESGRYPLMGHGKINLYAPFCELSLNQTNRHCRIGAVTPTGVATDSNTRRFVQHIVDNQLISSLYDFENVNNLFPGLDPTYRFCLLTLTGEESPSESFELTFHLNRVEQLHEEWRAFEVSKEDIELINPNTMTLPTFQSKSNAELALDIYRSVGAFIDENSTSGNKWGAEISTMYNMASDSDLFADLKDIGVENIQGTHCDDIYPEYLPLYESKMVKQYDHRYLTFDLVDKVDNDSVELVSEELSTPEKADPYREILARYWVGSETYSNNYDQDWHFVVKDIARAAVARTAIGTIIPGVPVGDTLNMINSLDEESTCLVLAALNSYVCDFVTKQKISGRHLNHYMIKQLPIPDPQHFEQKTIQGTEIREIIIEKSAKLTYTSHSLDEFASPIDSINEVQVYDEGQRSKLRAELEALLLIVYDIGLDSIDTLFDQFEVVKRTDIDEYGKYKTRNEIKKEYKRYKSKL